MKKLICFALALMMLCCMFTGCTPEENAAFVQPRNVACVFTVANNNPRVDTRMIDELSALPGLPGSTYAVINAEGQPRVICAGEIPDFSDRGYSKAMLERIQASIAADINGQIDAVQPCTPEVDLASALVLAVRTIRANEGEDRENLLVFYTSGISTAGLIDMTAVPVCQMDVDASVSALIDQLDLNLEGIDVVFYACGDVTGDQPSLSSVEQAELKEFYQKLFLGMGADSVTFMADIPNGECYNFDHQVSVMLTEGTSSGLQASVISFDPAILESNEGDDVFAEPVVLTESQVTFIGDSAAYLHPEEAEGVLKPIADFLLSNDITILLCGTTAGDSNSAYTRELSLSRSNTVRQTLIDLGVDPSRIIAVGLGSTDPWHVPGISVSSPASSCNRKVVLLDASSQTALEILTGIDE